ncbi:MarR family transcriptional regulator [Lactobacillus sp. LC28-10]|uniref:MarR family transcriptional regulator n=1 Tax=Secundilactobacillus angelensis TaxID=2722706 RepID=A0ABX1KW30_9LACO|nr:MarR family transcriptional regulator [Secundilactobacillus angelensis]MCH5461816.1 MarR family transcriptional regulator [Secundilactobacillus angelensis]NLR17304.1 MarR family transcriptional regulator [Secundilactobacillus angelensis]
MAANTNNALELEQLFTDLTQAITQNRTLDEFGLTRLQAITLKNVYTRIGISMSQLADTTGISRAQLTRLITTLEKRDLVERRHNEDNRRVVNVYGTEHGKTVIHEHSQLIANRIQSHTQNLSATEQTALTHHLREAIRLMIKAGIITPDDQSPLNQIRKGK